MRTEFIIKNVTVTLIFSTFVRLHVLNSQIKKDKRKTNNPTVQVCIPVWDYSNTEKLI